MQHKDASKDEAARLAEVARLTREELETTALNDIVQAAAALCGTPIALISIVERDRQRFLSRVGLEATETPRDVAFCSVTIQDLDHVLVVEDATLDERFADNPLVVQEPKIRFYAAAPLVTSSGLALGTVCVIDHKPRVLPPEQLEQLQFLARQVVETLERKKASA